MFCLATLGLASSSNNGTIPNKYSPMLVANRVGAGNERVNASIEDGMTVVAVCSAEDQNFWDT